MRRIGGDTPLDDLAPKRVFEFALMLKPLKPQGATGSTVAPGALHRDRRNATLPDEFQRELNFACRGLCRGDQAGSGDGASRLVEDYAVIDR